MQCIATVQADKKFYISSACLGRHCQMEQQSSVCHLLQAVHFVSSAVSLRFLYNSSFDIVNIFLLLTVCR